jgi:hypothetical protein
VDLDILDVTIFDGHALRPEKPSEHPGRTHQRDRHGRCRDAGGPHHHRHRPPAHPRLRRRPRAHDFRRAGVPGLRPQPGRRRSTILDGVTANRPTILLSADHHSAWVNQAAMSLAGIDATTPDPRGGVIVRDESGEPTGCLHEAAIDLVGAHVPPGERRGDPRRTARRPVLSPPPRRHGVDGRHHRRLLRPPVPLRRLRRDRDQPP